MPGSALSLVVSTIAFFVAGWFIKRWADNNDIPKGMTRNLSVFVLAAGVSYAVGLALDKLAALFGG
jgi:VIT1/CCC1 family predicted Fe2+/Mn2+ transporter